MADERIDCQTVETIERGKRYVHLRAVDIGSCSDGCCDRYRCSDCGTEWVEEGSDG